MSAFDRVLAGIKDVLIIREDVSRVSAAQLELEAEVLDHEKRLIRIETIIEFTQQSAQRRLPGQ